MNNGSHVTGEIGRTAVAGKIAFRLRAFESLTNGGLTGGTAHNQFFSDGIGGLSAGEGALDHEASGGMPGVAEQVGGAIEQGLNGRAGGGPGQCVAKVSNGAGGIAIERFTEEILFIAEGGVEAGSINAHGGGEIGEGSALVTFFPEDEESGVKGLVGVEGAGSADDGGGFFHFLPIDTINLLTAAVQSDRLCTQRYIKKQNTLHKESSMSTPINAPDLTQRPPRSVRVRLGGYVILPRMLDKCRATIAGKNGEFNYNCPLDQHLVNFLGMDPVALKAEVATGKGDGEILEWINKNAKNKPQPWEIEQWTEYQGRRGPTGDTETINYFAERVAKISKERPDIKTWADYLDLDDHCTFGGKA
jgi:Domain of unknown function (DUF5069)